MPEISAGWRGCGIALFQIDKSILSDPMVSSLSKPLSYENLRKALTYLDKAIAFDPNDHLTWYYKALSLGIIGQSTNDASMIKEGIECLEQDLRVKPSDLETQKAMTDFREIYESLIDTTDNDDRPIIQHSRKPVCDICDRKMKLGRGYILTTKQMLSIEAYWKHLLSHQGAIYHEEDPDGYILAAVLKKMAASPTNWLICNACSVLFELDGLDVHKFDQTGKSLPPGGPANHQDFAVIAAYAWSSLYDAWPAGVQLHPNPPPLDSSVCDFCRRRLYPEEEIQLLEESVLKTYEGRGILKRRGGHSKEIEGNLFWIACPWCIERANRIMGQKATHNKTNT